MYRILPCENTVLKTLRFAHFRAISHPWPRLSGKTGTLFGTTISFCDVTNKGYISEKIRQ